MERHHQAGVLIEYDFQTLPAQEAFLREALPVKYCMAHKYPPKF